MSSNRRTRALLALTLVVLFALVLDGFTGVLGVSDLLTLYRSQHVYALWSNKWLGVRLSQFPRDLATYAELIHKQRPDVIVETGTWYGASAFFLAHTLSDVRPDGKVITIDIDGRFWRQTLAEKDIPESTLERIIFIEGDSTAEDTLRQIMDHINGKSRLFIFDSMHTKDHVLKELRAYAPLVAPGEFMIVNDTHHDLMFARRWRRGGPHAAVKAFLAESNDFTLRPQGHPRALLTATKGGHLQRKVLPRSRGS